MQVCSCFCTPAIRLVSRFTSALSSPNSSPLSFSAFCHPEWNGVGWDLQESNTYFIPSYLLGTDAALFPALRGRKWLKDQRFIFTLGKRRITVLHLLGLRHIRINANIRLHGKYCTKYNVCEFEKRLCYRTLRPFKIHHVPAQLLFNCLRKLLLWFDYFCLTESKSVTSTSPPTFTLFHLA